MHKFQSNKLVTPLFESSNDLANESTLDTIWLEEGQKEDIRERSIVTTLTMIYVRSFANMVNVWNRAEDQQFN
jgi:hypothetical protein